MQHAELGAGDAVAVDHAGAGFIVVGQHQHQRTVGQGRQQRGLLGGRALLEQQAGADDGAGQQRLHQQAAAGDFHHRTDGDRVGIEATVVFGQAQGQKAELGKVAPRLAAVAFRLFEHGPALVEAVVVVGVAGRAVAQHADCFEISRHSPSTTLATMLRWISDEPPKMVAARL